MLDLVIRNGLIVDGSGLPGRHGDVSIHDGKVVAVGGRAGEAHTGARRHRACRRPRLHRPPHPLRRPAVLRPVRLPRDRARRHHGGARQLLAVAGTAADRAAGCVQPHVPPDRGDARSGLRCRRRLALGRRIRRLARRARREHRLERGPARRPLGAAHVRDGPRGPGAGGDRRRDRRDGRPAARVPRRRRGRPEHELRRHRRDLPPGAQPLGGTGRTRRAVGRARRARRRAADRPRVLRHRADDRPRRTARRPVAASRHHHHAVAAVPLRRQQPTASSGSWAPSKRHGPAAPRCGRRCRPARSTSASRSTSAA